MNTKFNDEIYGFLPEGIEGIDSLVTLALDIRWLWKQLDPFLWETTNNPLLVLQTVSWRRLKQQMDDPGFGEKINELIKTKEQAATSDTGFQCCDGLF